MAKKFAVWIEIEEQDEDNDKYETVGLPDVVSKFDTIEEADGFIRDMLTKHASPETIATSDVFKRRPL